MCTFLNVQEVATEGEESRGNWEEVAMDTESEPTVSEVTLFSLPILRFLSFHFYSGERFISGVGTSSVFRYDCCTADGK